MGKEWKHLHLDRKIYDLKSICRIHKELSNVDRKILNVFYKSLKSIQLSRSRMEGVSKISCSESKTPIRHESIINRPCLTPTSSIQNTVNFMYSFVESKEISSIW